jgi:octanoyl-[GcvH]:protein N-octanoyltransferase
MVAFGKQDAVSAGYADAVRAARAGGFEAVERLAGGRAAVFHEDTIAFAWATRAREPRRAITERFEHTAAIFAGALGRLGVDARVGEVPREYCPGGYSVNARGRVKLMGVGQRLIAGGAHVGGVVVVRDAGRVRDILLPVYAALGLDWDPATAGSVADEVPGVDWEGAAGAVVAELAERYELVEATLDEETLALARRLEPEHLSRIR